MHNKRKTLTNRVRAGSGARLEQFIRNGGKVEAFWTYMQTIGSTYAAWCNTNEKMYQIKKSIRNNKQLSYMFCF